MADAEDNSDHRMDLNLNLGPPSPPHLGLALGLGSTPASNGEIPIGQGSIRERLWPRFELVNFYSGLQDLDSALPPVSGAENSDAISQDEALQELFRQSDVRRLRSSQARHRWRRHVRRIRPTFIDSDEPHPFRVLRRNESVPPLFIFRTIDSIGRASGEVYNNRENSNNNSNNNNNNNPERPVDSYDIQKETLDKPQTMEAAQEDKESSNDVTNFECNICLDVSRDPVVTSCGHLFCWACLYQWLHVHSNTKECPVCKGEVTEMNITPIYGRGNTTAENESKIGENGEKVPPRPRARRIESLRQRVSRPISRRVVEAIRLSRRHGVEDGQNENRADGPEEGARGDGEEGVENLLGAAADQILNRFRVAQRLQRESVEERWQMRQRVPGRRNLFRSPSVESRTATSNARLAGDDVGERIRGGAPAREGDDIRLEFNRLQRSDRARSDRLAAIRARLASMEGMLQTLANTNNHAGEGRASASLNSNVSGIPDFLPDQGVRGVAGLVVPEERASVSSTNAVIQTESRSGDALLEQESVRSSPQRRRNGASGSLDVDGGLLHARKRRRLN